MQVDNQLPNAVFPVLLRPSWSASEAEQPTKPLALELRAQVKRSGQVPFYETVAVRLQTMELMVDTLLVRQLTLFAYELLGDAAHLLASILPPLAAATAAEGATDVAPSSRADADGVAPRANKVYVRRLEIQPLRVLVSCRSVAGGLGLGMLTGHEVPSGALGLLNSLSALISNVDRVPIRLKELRLDNAFVNPDTLFASIVATYREQVWKRALQ